MTRLRDALAAAQRGWHIFPVEPRGKLPHLVYPDKPYRVRWADVATNDAATIATWWAYSPDANIGLAAKPSGLLILDLDTAKTPDALKGGPWGYLHDRLGPYVDGDDALREVCQRFGGAGEYDRLMRTYRVQTSSLGCHLYLRMPPGVQASQASPVPGALDVRSNGGDKGGYVLAAGSETEKGRYVVENDAPILDAASFPWLIEFVRDHPRPVKPKPLFSQAGGGNHSGLVSTVRHAQEGQRVFCLHWSANRAFEDGLTEDEVVALLTGPAEEAGLDYAEAEGVIRRTSRNYR